MKKKTLNKDEKIYIKRFISHIPKIDPIYGLEGYVYDICFAADIRKGRPTVCKVPDCYSSVISYQWNNPDYERQLNPFGYFKCAKCGALYLERNQNKTKSNKKY